MPNPEAPAGGLTGKFLASHLRRGLRWVIPHRLELQLALLTATCLVLSILGSAYYSARTQTEQLRQTMTAQLQAQAQNLATVNAHFLLTHEPEQIEKLTLQTATVPGIYSVLVTDQAGFPIAELINKQGQWSPRYSKQRVNIPPSQAADALLETLPPATAQKDFLAGASGTLSAWHRIQAEQPLGWVRVNYRLDSFETLSRSIERQALETLAIATIVTLALLLALLRPAMRALRQATAFAGRLDSSAGATLKVARHTAEIEALGNALNVVSKRLLLQNVDLNNQQFALDQHAIVSITDLQGQITYANQRFCDISGYSQHELMGKNHRIVKSDEHPPEVFENLWSTITRGQVWRGDIKNRKKDGGFYWVNATIVPLVGLDGLPHQFIGIRTDITVNKILEQSLQLAKEQAEGAALAKGQFLANMSHEIRTPMNAILGMLRLLQNTALSERQHDYTGKAEGAAQSLLGLLNDILDFSKIDAGKMVLEAQAFQLDKLLRDLSVIVSGNVGAKPVEVLFDIDPATPKTLIGDLLRLHQVLINLCGNAVKFTARGEVLIQIKVRSQSARRASLRFAVQDSGIGIAPENQRHIFDGFSQAEASTTRRFGGTGLGLSISRRLVALMGGELRLQSELGKGSTFFFDIDLPIGQAPAQTPEPGAGLAPGLRVLVVDDNPNARDILAAMARTLGWEVALASDGQQALSLLQSAASARTPFRVMLLDWQMPDLGGWEIVERLQAHTPPLPPLAVLMVTASGRDMLAQRSAHEQASLQGYLVKPVTATMLQEAVRSALRPAPAPAPVPGAGPAQPPPAARPKPLAGLRLLVVEDNIINQQVAQEMLGGEGAEVALADNGQLGVEAVHQAIAAGRPFNLVLMDLQMPVMDGYAATRVLREELGLRQLPIIAMTANAMDSDRQACLQAGMNEHIGKPFHLAQLTALILNPPPLAGQAPHTLTQNQSLAPADIPAPVQQAAAALPPVDSVDSLAALERLGSNPALYGRVLQSFLLEIDGFAGQFEASLSAQKLLAAQRQLHTLKGLASTVGAGHLAAVARRAELALVQASEGLQPLDVAGLAGDLRRALDATHIVIERLAQSLALAGQDPGSAAPAGATQVAATAPADLLELLQLLERSDMRATDVFEQLRQHAAPEHSALWQALQQAMERLDFSGAAQAAHQLLARQAQASGN